MTGRKEWQVKYRRPHWKVGTFQFHNIGRRERVSTFIAELYERGELEVCVVRVRDVGQWREPEVRQNDGYLPTTDSAGGKSWDLP